MTPRGWLVAKPVLCHVRQGEKGCAGDVLRSRGIRDGVRGQRLDGPHEVRFDDPAIVELILEPGLDALPGGWRDYPSFTRLQAPGCYAYQVDTETDSTVIVFRAEGPTVAT